MSPSEVRAWLSKEAGEEDGRLAEIRSGWVLRRRSIEERRLEMQLIKSERGEALGRV